MRSQKHREKRKAKKTSHQNPPDSKVMRGRSISRGLLEERNRARLCGNNDTGRGATTVGGGRAGRRRHGGCHAAAGIPQASAGSWEGDEVPRSCPQPPDP